MLSDCRRLLLLLAASWAILSLARLSPIQVTEEIPPVLLYGVPGFLTVAICFLPPQSWEPERWFVVSAVVLVAAVAICWLPIAISFWMVMPSSFGSSVVSLLFAAVLFGVAYRQTGYVGPLPARTALTTLCLASLLLLYHVTADVSFPFKVDALESYGPYRIILKRRGEGGFVAPNRTYFLIRETPLGNSGLVWRRQFGKCPAHCELSSKELVVGAKRGTAQRRIPLAQLAGSDPPDLSDPTDLSKM
jgi:hypothetical protein